MASELYLCMGTLSSTPYFLSGLGVNIYSMDELCYYLCQNAYILDNDFIDVKICDYIRDYLGMEEIAEYIRKMINDKKTLGEIVTSILTMTNYCTEAEIKQIRQILVDNASMSFAAKRKARGDNLLKADKYARAIEEYQFVLSGLSKEEEPELYGAVLHNLGCAYGKLFMLDKAKSYFKRAYDLDGDRESLIMFLICLRLASPKEEYDRIVVKNGYDERVALEALRRLGNAREVDTNTQMGKQMRKVSDLYEEGRVGEYYKAVSETIESWKVDYRHNME